MFTGFRTDVVHEAICPEIAPPQCADFDIPEHTHEQTLNFFQLNLNVNRAVFKNTQLMLMLPIDIKNSSIEYRLLSDNSPYNPPYAGIHHRNETLVGFGDARVGLNHFVPTVQWVFGLGTGTTVPLGKTEQNPYILAEEGESHQHFQMGTGVFSPFFNATAIYKQNRWGIINSVMAQLSLYENDKTYAPGNKYRFSVTPWWVQTPKLRYLVGLAGAYESPETWSGNPAPNAGKKTIGLSGAVLWNSSPTTEWSFRIESNLYQDAINKQEAYQNDQIPPAVIFTLGLNLLR